MKYIDFVLIFLFIFICAIIPYDFHLLMLQKLQVKKINYNQIFDTAVQDAIFKCMEISGEHYYINPSNALNSIRGEVGEVINYSKNDSLVVVITDDKGFWINDEEDMKWNEYQRNDALSVCELRDAIEAKLNDGQNKKYIISLPFMEGDDWYNAIGTPGVFVIYESSWQKKVSLNPRYSNLIVSGAMVRRK